MKNKLIYLVVVLYALSSCTTDIDYGNLSHEVGYNTSLVIPIGTVHTTLDKLLGLVGDDFIKTDAELNTCYLFWNDSIIIETGKISIADFSQGKEIVSEFDLAAAASPLPLPGFLPAGTYNFPQEFDYDFDYADYEGTEQVQRIDSAIVESASLYLLVNATDVPLAAYPVTMKVEFPDIPELQTKTFIIDHDGQEINHPLGHFKLRFGTELALTPLKVTYSFTSDGALPVATTSKITTKTQFKIIDCTKAWGYFNKKEVITGDDITQNIPTSFFESSLFKDNNLLFNNPLIDFRIVSDIGIPMDFEVEQIKATDRNGVSKEADFNGQPNCVIRLEKPANEGEVSENWAHFTKDNGRTDRLFEITPASFSYKFNVSVSTFKNEWEKKHYIFFPPKINMYVTAKLPFHFNPKSYYAYNDTLPADLAALIGEPIESEALTVDNLNIQFKTLNKLPMKAVASASFLDENDVELYLQEGINITSAVVDKTTGLVTAPVKSEFSLKFTQASIKTIAKTKKIVLYVKVDGQDEETPLNFQLNDEMSTTVSLFLKGGLKANLDSLGTMFK